MKKFFAVLCVISLVCFSGGCSVSGDAKLPKLEAKIERDVKISSSGEEFECKLYHTPEGLTSVTFTSPKNLKGFTISRGGGGKFQVTQGGLEADYAKDPLPADSAVKWLMDILDVLGSDEVNFSLKNEAEGEKTYKGNLGSRECEVVLNSKDEIIRISALDPEIIADFKP